MATVNEQLSDIQVSHALNKLKAANGMAKDYQRILKQAEADLVAIIAKRLAKSAAAGDTSAMRTARFVKARDEIAALYAAVYGKIDKQLVKDLKKVALNEFDFQADALSTTIPVNIALTTPVPAVLTELAMGTVIGGISRATIMERLEIGMIAAIEDTVNTGIVAGQSIDDIVRGMVGKGLDLPRRQLRQMTRTAVMSVANEAAQATYAANQHVVKGWQYVATLDTRTCSMCAAYDGNFYKIGKGPVPPLHPNSRSISIPVTKSYDELGIDKTEYTNKVRASMDGQIASPKDMEELMKSWSVARQETILGKTKARLWREGKFSLADYVRDDNTIMSLEELRKLKPSAFAN